jgi:hypothetical protein
VAHKLKYDLQLVRNAFPNAWVPSNSLGSAGRTRGWLRGKGGDGFGAPRVSVESGMFGGGKQPLEYSSVSRFGLKGDSCLALAPVWLRGCLLTD